MTILNPHSLAKIRSEALMSGVRGMPCTLRVASFMGLPCASVETVCAHHLPVIGGGMSTKVSDLFTVAACATCHEIVHGKAGVELRHRYPHAYMERLLMALCETQARHVMAGRIVIPDGKEV